VYYFYRKALALQEARRSFSPGSLDDEEPPEVREESFCYHGPKPQTRECAIISLADAVESASRCLEKVTPNKIDQLVEEIIQRRVASGELKECDLRFSELSEVAESFKSSLRSMTHARIVYPKPVSRRDMQSGETFEGEERPENARKSLANTDHSGSPKSNSAGKR